MNKRIFELALLTIIHYRFHCTDLWTNLKRFDESLFDELSDEITRFAKASMYDFPKIKLRQSLSVASSASIHFLDLSWKERTLTTLKLLIQIAYCVFFPLMLSQIPAYCIFYVRSPLLARCTSAPHFLWPRNRCRVKSFSLRTRGMHWEAVQASEHSLEQFLRAVCAQESSCVAKTPGVYELLLRNDWVVCWEKPIRREHETVDFLVENYEKFAQKRLLCQLILLIERRLFWVRNNLSFTAPLSSVARNNCNWICFLSTTLTSNYYSESRVFFRSNNLQFVFRISRRKHSARFLKRTMRFLFCFANETFFASITFFKPSTKLMHRFEDCGNFSQGFKKSPNFDEGLFHADFPSTSFVLLGLKFQRRKINISLLPCTIQIVMQSFCVWGRANSTYPPEEVPSCCSVIGSRGQRGCGHIPGEIEIETNFLLSAPRQGREVASATVACVRMAEWFCKGTRRQRKRSEERVLILLKRFPVFMTANDFQLVGWGGSFVGRRWKHLFHWQRIAKYGSTDLLFATEIDRVKSKCSLNTSQINSFVSKVNEKMKAFRKFVHMHWKYFLCR